MSSRARSDFCLRFLFLFSSSHVIQQVKSRTKEFAYGLYWKQNRKNCMAFLSLDSKLGMEAHMRWVECQIQSLEAYRRGSEFIFGSVSRLASTIMLGTSFSLFYLARSSVACEWWTCVMDDDLRVRGTRIVLEISENFTVFWGFRFSHLKQYCELMTKTCLLCRLFALSPRQFTYVRNTNPREKNSHQLVVTMLYHHMCA